MGAQMFPEVKKKFGRLASASTIGKAALGAAVAASVTAVAGATAEADTPPQAGLDNPTVDRVIALPGAPSVKITDGDKTFVATHYSHSSHASHASHTSSTYYP
jgi:hypothetical protein